MSTTSAYQAARRTAARLDLSSRGRLLVRGADRAAYLQGLLTNDIEALEPGIGCYAAYLTPQGRMIADMQVLHLGDALLLDLHESVTAMLEERLREFVFTEEVTIEDRSAPWTSLAVHGPESARRLAGVLADRGATPGGGGEVADAGTLERLDADRHLEATLAGSRLVIARSADLGETGFTLYLDRAAADPLTGGLDDAGVPALSPEDRDVLRVEAGRPVFPDDLGPDVIPLEAGIEDRAISMTKGCYVGQEVIIRVLHRGQGRVARRLVGLRFEGDVPPAAGARLVADGCEDTDDAVGRITSSVWSPAVGHPIGLGYVKRDLAEPGARLRTADHPAIGATVAALPFVGSSGSQRP